MARPQASEVAPRHRNEWYVGEVTVAQVLAGAKTWSRAEQPQVRDTLEAGLWLERPEEQGERMLYQAGLLRAIHPLGAAPIPTPRCPPAIVNG